MCSTLALVAILKPTVSAVAFSVGMGLLGYNFMNLKGPIVLETTNNKCPKGAIMKIQREIA